MDWLAVWLADSIMDGWLDANDMDGWMRSRMHLWIEKKLVGCLNRRMGEWIAGL